MAPQCSALNVSDQSRCNDEATSLNGLFCPFHSKQCQGLYRGYKIRNARLDALAESPPSYLASNPTPLANQTFADIKSEDTLRELHSYLALRYALLDRVIRARKIHHTRFFSMNMDYGHQNYLDNLQNQKFIVTRALERLERRTAEVMFKRQNWFKWVRECQDKEEAERDNEKKKIKKEAALFKRHWNQFKLRMKELRAKEDMKRQDKYLDEVYNERMSMEDEEATWDPIDDVVEDERGTYIDMINLFLMLKEDIDEDMDMGGNTTPNDSRTVHASGKKAPNKGSVDKTNLDTKAQMRKRLREGVEYTHGAMLIRGTIENPVELAHKSAPLPDGEIDRLLEDISEIKHLLFCRLLLSHASLFPAAIRANSVEEFLNDKEVHDSDLRDLCLAMGNPGLQEVRDACADLIRGEEEEPMEPDDEKQDESGKPDKTDTIWRVPATRRRNNLPQFWNSKRSKQLQKREEQKRKIMDQGKGSSGTYIDFGAFADETEDRGKKMRVKVCGKAIYNYPCEKAMNRGGWLHFCIIANNSNLFDAVNLCRHWDEFFELNILAVYQFFPAANWLEYIGDRLKVQFLQLGFFPYQEFRDAAKMTVHHQSGSRGHIRRAHAIMEARNFVAAHISRKDQATRRLIRYLSMQTHRVLLLVRDAKTGRILVAPPEDELWLVREKSGVGRASKNCWNVIKEVGTKFFDEIDANRKWTLSFDDYYDIIVWDLEPGKQFSNVYSVITQMLFKAHRFRSMRDTYNVAAPILKTLTRDHSSHRVREIKAEEEAESIYDEIQHEDSRFQIRGQNMEIMENPPKFLFYNDADALEDRVLFPEETIGEENGFAVGAEMNKMEKLEYEAPDFKRFVHDLDTDEDVPSGEDYAGPKHTCMDEDSEADEDEDEDEDWEDGDTDEEYEDEGLEDCQGPVTEEAHTAIQLYSRHLDNADSSDMENPEQDMKDQFMRFLRRESSKVFKAAWHKADLEPCGPQKYADMLDLVKRLDEAHSKKKPIAYIGPLAFLDINPHGHRRVLPDMHDAFAKMAMFFPSATECLEPDLQEELMNHLIVNQAERAKTIPDRKRHNSTKTQPKQFWNEWKEVQQKGDLDENFPDDWDQTIRPIIAHLYREGIIRSGYSPPMAGQAIAAKVDGRKPDLFIDFHDMMHDITFNAGMQDPPSTEHFFSRARRFAKDNPTARFAALRLWSAPHFYPLLIGVERRQAIAFHDGQGRAWEWKFIPKDMPYSEWSMNHQARMRLEPFKRKFGDRVLVKSDLFLVMGTDEKDLLKLAAAATYAVQTDPWRLEVDLWRSFVNVELGFLEDLDRRWLD